MGHSGLKGRMGGAAERTGTGPLKERAKGFPRHVSFPPNNSPTEEIHACSSGWGRLREVRSSFSLTKPNTSIVYFNRTLKWGTWGRGRCRDSEGFRTWPNGTECFPTGSNRAWANKERGLPSPKSVSGEFRRYPSEPSTAIAESLRRRPEVPRLQS